MRLVSLGRQRRTWARWLSASTREAWIRSPQFPQFALLRLAVIRARHPLVHLRLDQADRTHAQRDGPRETPLHGCRL